jgi:hypothetical protein
MQNAKALRVHAVFIPDDKLPNVCINVQPYHRCMRAVL